MEATHDSQSQPVKNPKYSFEERSKIRTRIKELAAAGLKLEEIRSVLTREGFTSPDGSPLECKGISAQARQAGVYFRKSRPTLEVVASNPAPVKQEQPPQTVKIPLEQIPLMPEERFMKTLPELNSPIDQVKAVRLTLALQLPAEMKLKAIGQIVGGA